LFPFCRHSDSVSVDLSSELSRKIALQGIAFQRPHIEQTFGVEIMKSSKMLVIAVVSSLFALGAGAEEYHGVQSQASALKRDDVNREAVAAASAPNQNVPATSRVAAPMNSTRDRAAVQAEAERTSSAPDQNVAAGSRVNSKVISTMENPVDVRARAQGNTNSKL